MRHPALLPGRAALMGAALALPAFGAAPPAHAPTAGYVVRAPDTSGVVEWMKNPPPQRASSVLLKGDQTTVGVILPADIKPGETVSGTAVVMPKAPGATAETSGVVELETPDGKKHTCKTGDVITFVAGSGAIALLASNGHHETAKADCPLANTPKVADTPRGAPPKTGDVPRTPDVPEAVKPAPRLPDAVAPAPRLPYIVQDNCAVSLPIPSDGKVEDTVCKIGGQPAQVIAAKQGEAIVVPHELSGQPGKVPIEAECNGEKATLEGWAVHAKLTSPPRMRVGERGTATLTILLGDAEQAKRLERGALTARVTNNTPEVVSLGGKVMQVYTVDPRKIRDDGTTDIEVPFTALRPGVYTISSTVGASDTTAEGCRLTCTGCQGSNYFLYYSICNDGGTVNCFGQKGKACGGACGGHRAVGGPCGFHFCACSFGKCHCR